MSYTFEILQEADEDHMSLAIRDCLEPTKEAMRNSSRSDDEVVDIWKNINKKILKADNAVYVQWKKDGVKCGFATALLEGDTFHVLGGFPTGRSGPNTYKLSETRFRAAIKFVKDLGYRYLVFEVYRTGLSDVSFSTIFDQYNINHEVNDAYAKSDGYTTYRIDVTLE